MLKQRGGRTPEGYWTCEAAERNKQPILTVLQELLTEPARVLEIASGTGQHAVHFATSLPHLNWQPTEPDADLIASTNARCIDSGLTNLARCLPLNVEEADWPAGPWDAIFNANMIHVAPPSATLGLFRGAGQVLAPQGLLLTYGPYRRDGAYHSDGDQQFDATLKATNPGWGLRDLSWIRSVAADHGLILSREIPMPANNFMLVFTRNAAG
ncbi:MAG: DUF938 domain-containing protein [Pseudomonadales bacterium]|nr:DUF938 domain-containing protein [Pseudomonadales bacterium]